MFIKHLQAKGILSFGPEGIDLPLNNLNVLIGPNGSGKSNLLELFALLKAAPQNLAQPISEMGGISEWLWKDESGGHVTEGILDVIVENLPQGDRTIPTSIRHVLNIGEHAGRFEVVDERIESATIKPTRKKPSIYYSFRRGNPVLADGRIESDIEIERGNVSRDASILSQYRDPKSYPVMMMLQRFYPLIRMYRNWSFGPIATLRYRQSTQNSGNFLNDGGDNLVLVLHELMTTRARKRFEPELIKSLNYIYDGTKTVHFDTERGLMQLRLEESGTREIPASRLSDGTLRYLCLLSILLHPDPPPFIVIEEPELGLHPDVIPHIAELIQQCSERTQLVVTTHSRMLIDALVDSPEAVIVCEKHDGQSHFERLDPKRLADWLEHYSLGQLWSMGEIGGNRW
jgi:predicted ATPase